VSLLYREIIVAQDIELGISGPGKSAYWEKVLAFGLGMCCVLLLA
jgi:hypothetical protein